MYHNKSNFKQFSFTSLGVISIIMHMNMDIETEIEIDIVLSLWRLP